MFTGGRVGVRDWGGEREEREGWGEWGEGIGWVGWDERCMLTPGQGSSHDEISFPRR
jgi:hypothetical protein